MPRYIEFFPDEVAAAADIRQEDKEVYVGILARISPRLGIIEYGFGFGRDVSQQVSDFIDYIRQIHRNIG